ncbi:MAG: Ig-like domain-containing protein [Gemmatimonadales bacterium]|nr:Ig-like domain-containing protein [Gemmatimonadales bacterium]
MKKQLPLVLAAAVAVACARMAPPPGGPPDARAPLLIATTPESIAVIEGFDGWVEFQFDEVISEGGQPNFGLGTGDLERLVTLSPGDDVPRVTWHRNRISVRPQGGWRPNTVYRVELAPGVRDLRDNRTDTATAVTFATGGPLPTHVLVGRAVDWGASRPAALALVEATLLPDSLVYRTVADSTGRFRFGPLPDGEYLVGITVDQDRNRRRGGREAWDTVRTAAGNGNVGEVWAFQRDTLPPRATDVTRLDSLSISITLTQPVDPALRIEADGIVVRALDDSASAGPITALPRAMHDSLYKRAIAPIPAADTTRRADTTAVPRVPARAAPVRAPAARAAAPDTLEQKRPKISTQLVVRVRNPLVAGTRYAVIVRSVRALGGAVADSVRGTLDVPKPPPVDTLKARTDSAKADSAKVRADSIRADSVRAAGGVIPPAPLPTPPPRDTVVGRPRR